MYQLEERIHFRMEVAVATGATLAIKDDASPMVRKELLVLLSCLVKEWRGYFVVCAWLYWEGDRKWRSGSIILPHNDEHVTDQAVSEWLDGFGDDDSAREENRVLLSSFFTIFVVLLEFSIDPYQEVATNAQTVVDYIMALLLESPFTRLDCTTLGIPPTLPADQKPLHPGSTLSRAPSVHGSPLLGVAPPSPNLSRPGIVRTDSVSSTITSGVSNTLKRTSSFANALKSLAGGIAFPPTEDGRLAHSPGATHSRTELLDMSRPPSPNLNVAQYTSPYSRPPTPQTLPDRQSPPVPASRELPQHTMDFLPSDVMEALMEEDMERLRARRRTGTHPRRHGGVPGSGSMPSPSGSTFSTDSNGSSIILGLGTGVGIRDALPLRSTFFDWCCEYFTEPQMRVRDIFFRVSLFVLNAFFMKQTEADEPGSTQYNYQVWRQQRNEQVLVETHSQIELARSLQSH